MAQQQEPAVSVVYDGITIGYDEQEDVWRFILRGRNRKAASLTQAKEFIDKPVPDEVKKAPFQPIEALYKSGYSYSKEEYAPVTITSLAEDSRYNAVEAWIREEDGSRRKVGIHSLYLKNDHNAKVIQQLKDIDKQTADLKAKRDKIDDALEHFQAEKEKVEA